MKPTGTLSLGTDPTDEYWQAEGERLDREAGREIRKRTVDKKWIVTGSLPVMYLNRLIPDSNSLRADRVSISDTVDNIETVLMLMSRFPLDISEDAKEVWANRVEQVEKVRLQRENLEVLAPVSPSAQFAGELREFQKLGLDFLLKTNGFAALCDEMGLGKGVTTISYFGTCPDALPACVVAPLIVIPHWEREIARFLRVGKTFHPKVIRIRTGARATLLRADIYLINYDLLGKRVEDLRGLVRTVIFDEVQALRNRGTIRYQAANELIGSEFVKHIIGLSGTPVYNNGGEIWSIANIIRPGLLGTYSEFLAQHCEFVFGKVRAKNPKGLYELLRREFLLRRRKIDVLSELPPKLRVKEHLEVDKDLYERDVAALLIKLDEKIAGAKTEFQKTAFKQQFLTQERQIAGVTKIPYVVQWVKACLLPDTLIPGDYLPVKDSAVGQEVVGLDGPDMIEEVMVRDYCGDIVEIKVTGTLPLTLTPEHPVLAVRRVFAGYSRRGNTYPLWSYLPPRWARPQDLIPVRKGKEGDYLVLPVHNGTASISILDLSQFVAPRGNGDLQASGPNKLPLTADLAWLIGIYVAEGSSSRKVEFNLGKHEHKLARSVRQVLRQLGYSPRNRQLRTGQRVIAYSVKLARFLSYHCGHHATEKRIPNFILDHSDKRLLQSFLRGYLDGDGCLTWHKGRRNIQSAGTVSRILALQLQMLTARLSNPFLVWKSEGSPNRIEGRSVHANSVYTLRRYSQRPTKKNRTVIFKDRVLFPVKGIHRAQYDGQVWNLRTKRHTYLANNLLVHNCLESEQPIVVYFHHDVVVKNLQRHLADYKPCIIVGGQRDEERDQEIQKFQEGKSMLMLASIRAGSLGINLTASCIVVFAELDWVPAIHRQAEDRTHRIGQEKQVLAYYLVADGTLDEKIVEVLVDKTEQINALLGDEPEGENTREAIDAIQYLRSLPAFKGLPATKLAPTIIREAEEE